MRLRFDRSSSGFFCPLASGRGGCVAAGEMEFAAIQQFPLHLFACFETDGGRQRQREIDVEARLLAFGADGLNFQRIFCLHEDKKLGYGLALCQLLLFFLQRLL
jgi:hypothetical protein